MRASLVRLMTALLFVSAVFVRPARAQMMNYCWEEEQFCYSIGGIAWWIDACEGQVCWHTCVMESNEWHGGCLGY
jgi:hypothetical protein